MQTTKANKGWMHSSLWQQTAAAPGWQPRVLLYACVLHGQQQRCAWGRMCYGTSTKVTKLPHGFTKVTKLPHGWEAAVSLDALVSLQLHSKPSVPGKPWQAGHYTSLKAAVGQWRCQLVLHIGAEVAAAPHAGL